MDDSAQIHKVPVAMRVMLDFSDAELAKDVARCLEFAHVDTSTLGDDATVVLGDGRKPVQHVGYVRLVDRYGTDTEQAVGAGVAEVDLCAPLSLTPLLCALGRGHSYTVQRRVDPDAHPVFAQYVGVSDAAISTRRALATAAARDVTVLILGESGTGKDVVARALHAGSDRAQGPFVPINCGAIPAELLESELFGHEKGAFTGAITQKIGRFELAHGGTLFLDEIGDLPYAMQVKLLRAIEQKSFERVGGTQTKVSDVRIVAATNKNLEAKIAEGEFREDLFYRLNVFPIELKPLRERTDDLALLINVVAEQVRREQGLHIRFSIDAINVLAGYAWPGNVRELKNLIQRLSIQFPNGLIRCEDLPERYSGGTTPRAVDARSVGDARSQSNGVPEQIMLPVNGIDMKQYLTRLEKSLIEQALEDTDSVVARAADRLHIRRTTLVEKMRKHGLNRTVGSIA